MTHDPRFSIIPGWIVTDPRLKGRDLQVLCLLGRHTDKAGWCRRSQVKMAEQLACARSTVQASIDRLADIGVVEKHAQPSADGRDSAHFYRVVYDRAPPSGYDFNAWLEAGEEENIPTEGDNTALPPADISAPPAGPEPAPPADPGSAPINVPCLTPPVERKEREGASERDERQISAGESKEAIERAFLRWWPTFPTYPAGSEAATRKAWFALTTAQRQACVDRTPDYIAKVGPLKKDYTFAHVYLSERHWERLADKAKAEAKPELVKPLGKAGMATRFVELLKPMNAAMPPAPLLVRQIIERGGEAAAREIAARRERYGWPKVYEMNEKAIAREGMVVPPDMVLLGADFVSVTLAGPVGQAWKRLFERMQLPWLRHPAETEYAYFPPVAAGEADYDKAVAAAFWAFKRKVEGDVHAAAE